MKRQVDSSMTEPISLAQAASEWPGFFGDFGDFGNDADVAIRDFRNAVSNRRVVPPQCKLRWAA